MATKYRVTINGFQCHRETWDDVWQLDGKRDEAFFAVNTKIIGRDGTVKRELNSVSDTMGDTWQQPGRVKAGSASDRGGIRTNDKFPDKDRPWERTGALDGHRYPPYAIWEGDLAEGGDMVMVTPAIYEWDTGTSVLEALIDWHVQTDQKYGQKAKDIFSKIWPVAGPVFDAVSLGIQTVGTLTGQWGMLGHQATRPIGLRHDPADPTACVFNATTFPLSSETAEYLVNANDQGLGPGITELRFTDDEQLAGDYSVYVQIEKVSGTPPAGRAQGDPFAYATSFDDTARVIYRAQDSSIHELFYVTGAGWGDGNLTALSGAPAAVGDPHAYVVPDEDAARVVYRSGGDIHGLEYKIGQGWSHADLSQQSGATAAAGSPFGYFTPFDGFARVVYRSGDGQLHELYAQTGQGWGHADLSASTGAPPAAEGPAAYVTPRDAFARVVYRSGDGHLHELYYKTGQGWGHADLSASTGAPPAAGAPMGYYTPFDDTARVVYTGQDGEIHELYYLTGTGWATAVSPRSRGRRRPTATPMATSSQTMPRRGRSTAADGHIHELSYKTGEGWGHADLSQLSGATPAAGDPFGYFTPFDSFARVVYRDDNGHIHELYYKTGQGWGHADLM